jgi:acetyltransferase-like isoleucine patch superfamily enzyme
VKDVYIHPSALVETDRIGAGTRIWAFSHILDGSSVGTGCNIGGHCFVEANVVIGNDVTIKNGNAIWDGVTLEDGVFVAPGVVFTNDLNPRSPRLAEASERYANKRWLARTIVRRGATLGAGSVILAGNEIGEFALVGAAALVTRDVPAHALVLGSPGRVAAWVCRCGSRLSFQGVVTACSSCGLEFRKEGLSVFVDE